MASYLLGIVGERNYQAAIAPLRVGHAVAIEAEPDNPHDPRAVRVSAGGRTIGYAPRDGWIARAVLDEGREISAIVHTINGGTKDAPDRGVVLKVTLDGDETEVATSAPARSSAGTGASGSPAGFASTREEAYAHRRRARGAEHPPVWIYGAAAIGMVVLVATCSRGKSREDAVATPAAIAATAQQKQACANLMGEIGKTGVIKDRPAPRRIDVDETTWAAMPHKVKRGVLACLAIDAYGTTDPPGLESTVAYGFHTGKRIDQW